MSHNLALTPLEMWSKYQFDTPSLPCASYTWCLVVFFYNLYCATKWPLPRCRELDYWQEFDRNGFEERFLFSEGSSNPIRDDEVIRVAGGGLFFELNI